MNVICKLLDMAGEEHRSFTASLTFAHTAARDWSYIGYTAYIIAGTEILGFYRDGLSVPLPDVPREYLAIRIELEKDLREIETEVYGDQITELKL